jgi:hypothetical protein
MGSQCLHVTARFATLPDEAISQKMYYDFDPTTSPKKSGKTPVKSSKTAVFAAGQERIREGFYVVSADPRRAKIVWRL